MRPRTLTVASFFSVAMAATLVGAIVTSQVRRPQAAVANTEGQSRTAGAFGLDTFRDIARAANPGVVNINTSKTVRLPRYRDPFRDLLGQGEDAPERLFPPAPEGERGERRTRTSLGSGFVIDDQGYILTNRHVIEGADEVDVTFPDGKRYEAKIIGQDARTDVALIKIEPKGRLVPIALGNSDQLDVGEWVMAVGNPFGLPGGGNSVTVGVVSFKGRDLELGVRNTSVEMIQTDAAINPGNSGGPLINTRGEVVGINTLIVTGGAQTSAGVGFSVPINVAKEILTQLRDKGKVTRGWMGVQIQPVTAEIADSLGMKTAEGALVSEPQANSPAAKAGILAGDVITAVNGHAVKDARDLAKQIAGMAPGSSVKLTVMRKGEEKSISVPLGELPNQREAKAATPDSANPGATDVPRLGLTVAPAGQVAGSGSEGVVVTDVDPNGIASDQGFKTGDVILEVAGKKVANPADVRSALSGAQKDGKKTVLMRVKSGEETRFVAIKLSKA